MFPKLGAICARGIGRLLSCDAMRYKKDGVVPLRLRKAVPMCGAAAPHLSL